VSLEYWQGFQKREKSLFVDLFYGQLKSRVQCTVCSKVSISFDPFNMLSVPIPMNKESKMNVKYFPFSIQEKPMEFIINIGEYTTFPEIKSRI
jgi:ubiquitin C-terminal hydrolase